jgi:hypothetical protein
MIRKQILTLSLVIIGSIIPLYAAHADTPQVVTFSAAPSNLNNGNSTLLSWATTGSSGTDLYFACPVGVAVTNGSGTSFACNTRVSASALANDSMTIIATNITGSTKNIPITLIPKDIAGNDITEGSATANIFVGTAAQPILTFTASSTIAATSTSVVLTWTGLYAGGANLKFDCVRYITLYASNGTPLQCGGAAFATDLPISGSVTVIATNSATDPQAVPVYILPAVTAGLYDETHALGAGFTVGGKPGRPSIATYSLSNPTIASNSPMGISWKTVNASGVQLQFGCTDGITITAGASSTPVVCSTNASATTLPPNGSTTLTFANRSNVYQVVNGYIIPYDVSGLPVLGASQPFSFAVLAQGAAITATSMATAGATSTPAQQNAAATSSATAVTTSTTHPQFTYILGRGMQNALVKALQTFLAQNSAIYPEGSTTGYFGPATTRAVGRLQEKYGISKPGDDGYGNLGPKTRAKINTLQTP